MMARRDIEEIMRKAYEEGKFDDLPGKGRPLKLERDTYVDPEWQLAYDLLKQNNFAPAFIEHRNDIEKELAAARERLARTWAWRQRALAEGQPADFVAGEWQSAQARFRQRLTDLNKEIRDYNLQVPADSLYRQPVDADVEIDRLTR